MKLSTLQAVLAHPDQVGKLLAELTPLMAEYESLQRTQGSTIPIRVDADAEFAISLRDVDTLCSLFLSDQLTQAQLAYVADAIELSEGVSYDGSPIADLIAEMTDPKINGIFTKDRAEHIRKDIGIQQDCPSLHPMAAPSMKLTSDVPAATRRE